MSELVDDLYEQNSRVSHQSHIGIRHTPLENHCRRAAGNTAIFCPEDPGDWYKQDTIYHEVVRHLLLRTGRPNSHFCSMIVTKERGTEVPDCAALAGVGSWRCGTSPLEGIRRYTAVFS